MKANVILIQILKLKQYMHRQSMDKNSSIFSETIQKMQQKLAATILALESDQVIQQMRNDKTLYQYKLKHMQEIIDQYFQFHAEMNQLLRKNQSLESDFQCINQKVIKKDQEFREVIDMIQDSARKLTQSKDQEISKLNKQIQILKQKLNSSYDLSKNMKHFEQENEKLKRQINKIKQENTKLMQINRKIKNGQKQLENQNERSIAGVKHQYQKQIQDYEALVKKMQNDMLIIKSQWQKKCSEVQRNLRDFYEAELIKLEQKKTRELLQHLQSAQKGKPVVIRQDEDILTSRVESVRRQYQIQIQKLQRSNQQLRQMYDNAQKMYDNAQNNYLPKMKEIESLSDALRTVRNQFQEEKQNWSAEKQKSKRDIEKLKAIVLQFQRNNKDSALSFQVKQSEITKLNDNIKFILRKLQIANRSITEQKNALVAKQQENELLKSKIGSLEESNKKNKKTIDACQAELETKSKKVTTLTKQIESLSQKYNQSCQNEANLKALIKSLKNSKQKCKKMLDKAFLQVKQIQKQLGLLKEDIKYTHELHRKKNLTEMEKLIDQIQAFKEATQKQLKMRMNDFINQVEEAKQAEHAEFQSILRQRENLKRQVGQLEDLLTKKQLQVGQAKRFTMNAQTEQVKRQMADQLHRQKLKYNKLEEELLLNEKQYHRTLEKTKSEVKDAVRVLTSKWMDQVNRLQEDNRRKEFQLQKIVDKVQSVINQSEQLKKCQEMDKDQVKRFKKKYETLKQQKQQQINDLMKRLERQSKHKINLEKQLRTIRSELNRGDKYQKTDREVKSGNSSVTDRQKQITQIRQLIARTYQAVGEKPEKDNRIDRKRSPF